MMGTNLWDLGTSSQTHADFELFNDDIQAKADALRAVVLIEKKLDQEHGDII